MTDPTDTPMLDPVTLPRKPRIALMGEFSAGKSTLTNLMIGADTIPMQVTATQLPPVWISWGTDAPYREDLDGEMHPIDLDRLEDVPLNETKFVRIFAEADLLEICDLIDTPGISDPNMDAEVWQRAAAEADGVIWLTHATQAWRQSEAAVWDTLPQSLYANSIMLLTRMDKILSERDKSRVVRRVQSEARGLFREVLPISLIQAMASGNDRDKWEASGAETFTQSLLHLISDLELVVQSEMRRAPRADFAAASTGLASESGAEEPVRLEVIPNDLVDGVADAPVTRRVPKPTLAMGGAPPAPEPAPSVMPRRIAPQGGKSRERPARQRPVA